MSIKKTEVSTATALAMFIIFVAGWLLHGFFNKPQDCKPLLNADEKVFEAWDTDDPVKASELLIEAINERNIIIKELK